MIRSLTTGILPYAIVGGALLLALTMFLTYQLGKAAGEEAERAAWVERVERARDALREAEEARDALSAEVARAERQASAAEQVEVSQTTAEAVERIRYVYRTAEPAGCPAPDLPPVVRDEGRAAAERANAAHRALRARGGR